MSYCLELKNKWINGTISCGEGFCVSTSLLCNGVNDCLNGVDEKYCISASVKNALNSFVKKMMPLQNQVPGLFDPDQFQNSSIRCLNTKTGWITARICDGEALCDGLEDECNSSCQNPPPYCKLINTSCLCGEKICDGRWDSDMLCPNGRIQEEEIGCPNRFYCKSGNRVSVRLDQVLKS